MSAEVLSIDFLRDEIGALVRKYDADAAYLFGSYARGEANSDSDLDVVVDGGSGFSASNIFAIAEELHKATHKSVDVYEMSEINEGTAFYEALMRDRLRIA